MAVSGVGGTAPYSGTAAGQAGAVSNNEQMDMEDFWQLMAAELQYQDMTNPISNSEMMEQMTQMNSMNTMKSLASAVSNFAVVTNNLAQVTLTGYSTGMLGREVTVAILDDDGNISDYMTGVVEGVDLTGSQKIYIDGKGYDLSQIVSVGEVPEPDGETAGDKPEISEDTQTDGTEQTPEEGTEQTPGDEAGTEASGTDMQET